MGQEAYTGPSTKCLTRNEIGTIYVQHYIQVLSLYHRYQMPCVLWYKRRRTSRKLVLVVKTIPANDIQNKYENVFIPILIFAFIPTASILVAAIVITAFGDCHSDSQNCQYPARLICHFHPHQNQNQNHIYPRYRPRCRVIPQCHHSNRRYNRCPNSIFYVDLQLRIYGGRPNAWPLARQNWQKKQPSESMSRSGLVRYIAGSSNSEKSSRPRNLMKNFQMDRLILTKFGVRDLTFDKEQKRRELRELVYLATEALKIQFR